ncbi:MAG: SdrD B-like domain-containing protein [Methylococcales bacterium]
MKIKRFKSNQLRNGIRLALALPLFGVLTLTEAQAAINLTVVDHAGAAVSGFRWLVETDSSHPTTPGVRDVNALSLSFHNSDAPVLAEGQTAADNVSIATNPLDVNSLIKPGDRVFVSILPYEGHSIGGAMATVDASGNVNVEVTVENNPIPTAQMSVYMFHDKFPINNAPDGINEAGSAASCGGADHFCPQEFTVQVLDGGGGYGAAGPGPVSTDAFGNPLGTTYTGAINVDGTPTVQTLGNGIIHPDASGLVIIKNLVPGKYGINIIPPAGQGWAQTSTIEGTKTVDAWIQAGNPPFMNEWGPSFYNISIGFVKEFNTVSGAGGATIQGTIVNSHLTAPPLLANAPGAPFPGCRIGLNTIAGVGVYSGRCDANSHFSISNVPDGSYQLVAWDDNLDMIISFYTVDVIGGVATIAQQDAAGKIPAPGWFHTSKHLIFNDANENGFQDAGEVGLANKTVNLRFRDGRLYQTSPTDSSGEAEFGQVFPFFHWLVAESDFARDKATGVTIVSDAGGDLPSGSTGGFPDFGVLTPQEQICGPADALLTNCTLGADINNPNTGNNLSRTETGLVLTQAFQGFLSQTNSYQWGRKPYTGIENGGITGIVFYSSTRAENDPRYGVGDPWEPGVARVQVALYADGDKNNIPIAGFPGPEDVNRNGDTVVDAPDGIIDDINASGGVDRADVDNYPFGWADGSAAMGPEDVDNHPLDNAFNKGDAITIVTTDAWDDSKPTGCQGPGFTVTPAVGAPVAKDCYDGLRNYNQSRPGVFDGGYAIDTDENGAPLKPAKYIVEASPPKGMEIVKEEDVNVTLGDGFDPNPLLLPPVCVGDVHTVPPYLSLQLASDGFSPTSVNAQAAPFAGQPRPLCDLKQVDLLAKQNGVAEFHVFTKVPRSARVAGNVFNDVLATIDPNSPNAGEKANPAWIPVSFRDHTGKEVVRVNTDEWGAFNAQLPSTFTANAPLPSGFSPNMLTACVNDSGIVPNPSYSPGAGNNLPFIQDPNYDPTLATVCWVFQYMPGSTTYLDTPTVSKGSFASTRNYPVDCEQPAATPKIAKAEGVDGGAYVKVTGAGGTPARTAAQRTLTVTAVGTVEVPNPAYDGDGTPPKLIARNYGLGAAGSGANAAQVRLTNSAGTATTVNCTTAGAAAAGANFTCSWNSGTNTVGVQFGPTFAIGAYDLMLRSSGGAANGKWTPSGIKVTVGNIANPVPGGGAIHHVANGEKIQPVIDSAAPNDLILVGPGMYNEQLIMDKPLRLQGSGAPSTLLFAQRTDADMISNWHARMQSAIDNGTVSILPPLTGNIAVDFLNEEMAGISVFGLNTSAALGGFGNDATHPNARIDGFTITGAENGGGINVHGYADFLEISNNILKNNSGNAAGGIQIGRRELIDPATGTYTDASNDNIRIHNNLINQNGALGTGVSAAGGGIGLNTGTDGYAVKENFICGNFAQGDGAGIAHDGLNLGTALNPTNVIEKNTVVFNQSLYFLGAYGGGISVSGNDGLVAGLAGGLTQGSGPVVINANRIESNQAGSGDGGGVSLRFINGQDVNANVNNGYKVSLTNNIIANNQAALAGGGIVMQDAVQVNIAHNTVVNNDTTASVPGAFGLDLNLSNRHPAGIAARVHSTGLDALASVTSTFSNPLKLVNNIVWHNRAFQWTADQDNNGIENDPGLLPNIAAGQPAVYDDFGVLGIAGSLSPTYSILSVGEPEVGGTNLATAANLFVSANVNGNRSGAANTNITTARVFDEAGAASITVDFGPLQLGSRNYHLLSGTNVAVNTANPDPAIPLTATLGGLTSDYDAQTRLFPTALCSLVPATCPDKGADERNANNGTTRILP